MIKLSYGIFYTNNLETTSKFYKEVVGLELAFGNNRFIAFKIGESLLGIKVKEIEREVPGHQTIIVSVDNVESWYKNLKEKNVNIFSELKEESWGKNFSILDPDGNRVEFFTSK